MVKIVEAPEGPMPDPAKDHDAWAAWTWQMFLHRFTTGADVVRMPPPKP